MFNIFRNKNVKWYYNEQPWIKRQETILIAKRGFISNRNPIDTAGIDTSDEEWLYENDNYKDFIIEQYKYLKKEGESIKKKRFRNKL